MSRERREVAMAKIVLEKLAHAYNAQPRSEREFAVKELDMTWEQGGAYALLGPSGCGKTTLLNIISGLVTATRGRVLFDQRDVTLLPTEARNIAQVFQFPVVYDTLTVGENRSEERRVGKGVGIGGCRAS